MKHNLLKGLLKSCLCLIVCMGGMVFFLGILILTARLTRNPFLLTAIGQATAENPVVQGLGFCLGGTMQNTPFIVGPIILVCLVWKMDIQDLGYTSFKSDYKEFLWGIFVGILGITIALFLMICSGNVKISGVSSEYTKTVVIYFIAYVMVGFGEETFFRGGLMCSLRETENPLLIFLLPACLFGLTHLGNNGVTVLAIINLIGFGLFAGYCFYRSGSIWLSIGFHITWNFVQGNVYGFQVSGVNNYSFIKLHTIKHTIITGGTFGPEGGLGVTIALALIFVITSYRYKKQKR